MSRIHNDRCFFCRTPFLLLNDDKAASETAAAKVNNRIEKCFLILSRMLLGHCIFSLYPFFSSLSKKSQNIRLYIRKVLFEARSAEGAKSLLFSFLIDSVLATGWRWINGPILSSNLNWTIIFLPHCTWILERRFLIGQLISFVTFWQ